MARQAEPRVTPQVRDSNDGQPWTFLPREPGPRPLDRTANTHAPSPAAAGMRLREGAGLLSCPLQHRGWGQCHRRAWLVGDPGCPQEDKPGSSEASGPRWPAPAPQEEDRELAEEGWQRLGVPGKWSGRKLLRALGHDGWFQELSLGRLAGALRRQALHAEAE